MMLLLVTLLLKSLLVCAAAGLLLFSLRRSSAAARHGVCLWTLAALLALPLFSMTLPVWHLPVLAARQEETTSVYQAPTPVRSSPPLPPSGSASAEREGQESQDRFAATTPRLPVSGGPLRSEERTKQGGGFLLAFYVLGLLLASARPLLGLWGIRRLSHACVTVDDEFSLATAAACASLLGLRTPRLCRADVPVPMTWGWRHPVIALPLASADWPEDRLRSVLLHEMAHVKRRDWPGHRLADLACAVYWFHPLVWLTARRLRAESEAACDDLVLASGVSAPDYARHLLAIAQTLPPVSQSPHSAIAMAQTSRIERRLLMLLDTTQSRRTLTRRILIVALVPSAAALLTLAALRPGVKAQTMPALSVTKPSLEVTMPNGSVLSAPHIAITRDPHGSFLTVRSAEGSTVAPSLTIDGTTLFAGVTDANKFGSPWWSASGAVLSAPIYDTNTYHAEDHAGSGTDNVSFAFRLPADAQDDTVQYELPQSTGYSSDGFWPTKLKGNTGRTEAQMFAKTNGTRVVTASFPPSLTKTSLRVGIASGAWKTAAEDSIGPNPSGVAGLTGSMGIENGGARFLFSPIAETQDGLVFSLSTDATSDLRVIAITTEGQIVLPDQIGGNSIGTLDQVTARFALPQSKIKAFRVQTRPFQWIEFKDVALKPVQ